MTPSATAPAPTVSEPGSPGISNIGSGGTELYGGYLYQSSFANRFEGTMLGCNVILKDVEYTDFVAEMTMNNIDDDGIGFTFGWKSLDDHFRVHKINDGVWPNTGTDGVTLPHMKIRRKTPGVSCEGLQTLDSQCYQTIAFIDSYGPSHSDMQVDSVTPAGECGYSQTYLPFSRGDIAKMYLIVKDNQIRATYESPSSRRQVTVMAMDISKYNYAGGKVGVWTFSQRVEIMELTIADLSTVSTFCDGTGTCSERTGRCLGAPTVAPTLAPSSSPTLFPTPSVAANEFCQGPVSDTATTLVDTTDISQFLLVEHDLLTTDCKWSSASDGLTQSSDAWGNSPGDNTLMGCMAIFQAQTYVDFIAEIDVTHVDNDGKILVIIFFETNFLRLGHRLRLQFRHGPLLGRRHERSLAFTGGRRHRRTLFENEKAQRQADLAEHGRLERLLRYFEPRRQLWLQQRRHAGRERRRAPEGVRIDVSVPQRLDL